MYEIKDKTRVSDIITKGGGLNTPKALQLAATQANRIEDATKALHRGNAALHLHAPEIAEIFHARARELGNVVLTTEPLVLEPETMYFPTSSAVLLWMWEIKGQLSDGMWENTRPFNHSNFWCNLKVKVGPSAVNSNNYCVKKTYNIGGLKQHIGDRMLKFAKFGKANNVSLIEMGSEVRCIVEEFPAQGPFNLEEFKATIIKKSDWRSAEYYWKGLTQEMIDNYYKVKYTEIDLNNDIRYIKDTLLKAKGGNHLR